MRADDGEILNLLAKLEEDTKSAAELKKEREEAERQYQEAQSRVSAFGARLDDDVAGQNLDVDAIRQGQELYELLFADGVVLMQRGEYRAAVTAFTQATAAAPGGLTGRKGGQYAIYLAQALAAANRKKEAVGLLKRCESHPDQDVRKIADGVLYVMQAPELKLDEGTFLKIDAVDWDDDSWGRKRQPRQQKDPPPEKYSLEWYALEAEKRSKVEIEEPPVLPTLLACGALLSATAGLLLIKS